MVETTRTLEDIDTLLRRNWFMNTSDIIDLLYLANHDDWQWIVQNRSRYSSVIQDIICQEAGLPKLTCNIVVRDLTDPEYEELMLIAEKEYQTKIENNWQEYKKQHNLSPPRTFRDMQLDSLKLEYEKKYKEYNKRYPLNKDHIVIEIGNIKKEMEEIEDEIAQDARDWEFLSKIEFRVQAIAPKLTVV